MAVTRGGSDSAAFVGVMLLIALAALAVLAGVMGHFGWLLAGALVAGVRRLLRRRPSAGDGVFTPCRDAWVPPVPRQRGRVYQSRRSHPGG